jgi:guanosine-3',5'-bis(diphosphate) 3'-pyrophosphohydrolase
VIQKLINYYNLKTAQDLYCLIESEKIELLGIKEVLLKEESPVQPETVQFPSEKEFKEIPESQYSDYLVIEDRVEGLDYHLAKCCNPVFGDSIFGFVTISEGIKIHRRGCPNAHNMMSRYPYRVVSAKWTKSKTAPSFTASVKITGVENIGIVNKIADILAANSVTTRSFNYKMDDGMFEGMLNIMVPNNDVLHGIMRKINSIKGILKVTRSDSA